MSTPENTDPKNETKNAEDKLEAMFRQLGLRDQLKVMAIQQYREIVEQKKKLRAKKEQLAESDVVPKRKPLPKPRHLEQIKLDSELNEDIISEKMNRRTDLEKKLSEAEAELKAKQHAFQKRKAENEHESDGFSSELLERILQIRFEIEQIKRVIMDLLKKRFELINEQTMAESSAAAEAELKAEQDASKKQKALRQKQKEESADRYQPTSTDIEGGFVLVNEPVAKPSIGVKTTWSDKGKTLLADSLKEANKKSEDTEETSESNNRNGDDSFVVLESLKPRSKNAKKKSSAP